MKPTIARPHQIHFNDLVSTLQHTQLSFAGNSWHSKELSIETEIIGNSQLHSTYLVIERRRDPEAKAGSKAAQEKVFPFRTTHLQVAIDRYNAIDEEL